MAASTKGSYAWTVNPGARGGESKSIVPTGRPILFNSELYQENPSPRRRARPRGAYFRPPKTVSKTISAAWKANPQRRIRTDGRIDPTSRLFKSLGRRRRGRGEANPRRGEPVSLNILPTGKALSEMGKNPGMSILAGATGFFAATGAGAMVEYGLTKSEKFKDLSEGTVDAIRVGTKFGVGAITSVAISSMSKKEGYGAASFLGTLLAIGLDFAGCATKYIARKNAETTVKSGALNLNSA